MSHPAVRVERILAPNPGPFTGPGTNTYVLVSADECLIVDPGPVMTSHRTAIEVRVADLQPRGVLVTHTHPDHAPLANPLAARLGVPSYGYGPGPDFDPDRILRDGDRVRFGSSEIRVLHTPGHSLDHLCFAVGDELFSGDHIMGGGTVVVEDMASYLRSLERLALEPVSVIRPGHGEEPRSAAIVIASYLEHRHMRERQVLEALAEGDRTVGEVVERIYRDVDASLHPLAALSVLAHARKLASEGQAALSEAKSPIETRITPIDIAEEGPLGG